MDALRPHTATERLLVGSDWAGIYEALRVDVQAEGQPAWKRAVLEEENRQRVALALHGTPKDPGRIKTVGRKAQEMEG